MSGTPCVTQDRGTQDLIPFYVDNIPIRVFKNKLDIGIPYPNQPMSVQVSLWNGDWATDGGQTKIDWSHSPFIVHFQDFHFAACPLPKTAIDVEPCHNISNYWWNDSKYWKLSGKEQRLLEKVRQKYMNYDYCDDKNRHPTTPPECEFNK